MRKEPVLFEVAPLWTEDEMNFVASLLSDAPDVPYEDSPVSRVSLRPSIKTHKKTTSVTPEEKAAARRARHRESMRRSRQRFRDQMAAMVRTVDELEQLKADAIQQQHQRSWNGIQSQVAHLERQRELLMNENDALHAQLVDSLLAITRAHPNNFESTQVDVRVKGLAQRDDGSDHDFYVVYGDTTKQVGRRDPVTLCDFVTWDIATVGHCLQLVHDSVTDIAQFYAKALKDHESGGNADDLIGWRQIRRKLVNEDTCVEFAFDKIFLGQSSSEMFNKTWTFCRNQRSFAKMLQPVVHALQLEVLQQVNDDIVVVRRMQQDRSPEGEKQTSIKYRSIYLLYRMTTPAGLFVVFRSVNPSFTRRCGCANNLWFESFLWFGFSSVDATDSSEGSCRVRFGGSLDGRSEDFARRWQREIFFMLLRWETHNVAPFVLVQPF